MTMDAIEWIDPDEASRLADDENFFSVRWQSRWYAKQNEKLYNFLERWTSGDAEDKLEELGQDGVSLWQRTFDKEFGGGSATAIHNDQTDLKNGLPDQHGNAWPERCNVKVKLRALEKAQQELKNRCPVEQRDTYEYAQKPFLVRLILEHAHPIYGAVLQNIKKLHMLKREIEGVFRIAQLAS
jgi:hypothetical protein